MSLPVPASLEDEMLPVALRTVRRRTAAKGPLREERAEELAAALADRAEEWLDDLRESMLLALREERSL